MPSSLFGRGRPGTNINHAAIYVQTVDKGAFIDYALPVSELKFVFLLVSQACGLAR